jgi:hypothetical protein
LRSRHPTQPHSHDPFASAAAESIHQSHTLRDAETI